MSIKMMEIIKKENTAIKELSGAEPGVPSKSETYEPLDPPDNESNTGAVKSGPSNLDAEEQEEELEKSKPRRSTRETNPVMRLEPSMTGKSYLQEKSLQAKGSSGTDIHEKNIATI